MEELKFSYDLIDIWRIRNIDKRNTIYMEKEKGFCSTSFRFLVGERLLARCCRAYSSSPIETDHSAITLQIKNIESHARGPLHWRFNSSLLSDKNYVELISSQYSEVEDKRLLSFGVWLSIGYGKRRSRTTKIKPKKEEVNLNLSRIS